MDKDDEMEKDMKCWYVPSTKVSVETATLQMPLINLCEMDLNLDNICAIISHNMPPNKRTLVAQDIESHGGRYFKIYPPENSYRDVLYFFVLNKDLEELFSYFDTREDGKYEKIYYKSKDMIIRTTKPDMLRFTDNSVYVFSYSW